MNIFGASTAPSSNTSLKICYQGYGHPLIIMYVFAQQSITASLASKSAEFSFCYRLAAANPIMFVHLGKHANRMTRLGGEMELRPADTGLIS